MTGAGPVRVVGDFGSGKTTWLRDAATRLDAPLVICATAASARRFGAAPATTFWGLAVDIVERHEGPVHLLPTPEQRAIVRELGVDADMADAVAHYQASFLGVEELRTHAHAAGVPERWEELARFTDTYLDVLRERGLVDWGGALVRASLLLRDEDIAEAERGRFDRVLVDDYEAGSFASQRLLAQLAGHRGNVTVAGNPEAGVWQPWGGSVSYLTRFDRRFGAEVDERLGGRRRAPADVEEGVDGEVDAVLVTDERLVEDVAGEVGGTAWPNDPWVEPPAADGEAGGGGGGGGGGSRPVLPVLPALQATSLAWERVLVVATEPGPVIAAAPTYDLDLLGGPDIPDEATRAARHAARTEAVLRLARSRATAQNLFKRFRP